MGGCFNKALCWIVLLHIIGLLGKRCTTLVFGTTPHSLSNHWAPRALTIWAIHTTYKLRAHFRPWTRGKERPLPRALGLAMRRHPPETWRCASMGLPTEALAWASDSFCGWYALVLQATPKGLTLRGPAEFPWFLGCSAACGSPLKEHFVGGGAHMGAVWHPEKCDPGQLEPRGRDDPSKGFWSR